MNSGNQNQDIASAIQAWEKLAIEAKEWAEYEYSAGRIKEPFGHDMNPFTHQYEERMRAAESLRLELKTGKAHCVCHLSLFS